MRAAARYISQALRVAVRLNKTDIGNQIFDFFADNPLYRQSTSLYFAGQLVNDCMRYGNMDLIKGAFVYQENGCYHSSDKDQTLDFTVSADDEEFLFKHGTLNAFRALIKTRLFNPNAGKFHRVPLEHALARRKYKIAQILVEHGADPNATAYRKGQPILCTPAFEGCVEDVMFLLKHGANPEHPDQKLSPLQSAIYGHNNKCTFLLTKVKEHGKDYLERSDLWKLYAKDNTARHAYD
jgi:hypothetical protein